LTQIALTVAANKLGALSEGRRGWHALMVSPISRVLVWRRLSQRCSTSARLWLPPFSLMNRFPHAADGHAIIIVDESLRLTI